MADLYPIPLDTVLSDGGGLDEGAAIRVRAVDDDALVPMYDAPDGTTPVAQPVIADEYGRIPPRWVEAGAHKLVIDGNGGLQRQIPFTLGVASKLAPELAGSVVTESGARSRIMAAMGCRFGELGDSTVAAGDGVNVRQRTTSVGNCFEAISGGRVQFARNAGVAGQRIDEVMARFDTDVVPYDLDMLELRALVNGSAQGRPLSEFQGHVIEFVGRCRKLGIAPVLCTMTPINAAQRTEGQAALMDAYCQWIRQYGQAERVPVIDYFALLSDPWGEWVAGLDIGDGVHPNDDGNFVMAKEKLRVLSPILPPAGRRTAAMNAEPSNRITHGCFVKNDPGEPAVLDASGPWVPTTDARTAATLVDRAGWKGKAVQVTVSSSAGQTADANIKFSRGGLPPATADQRLLITGKVDVVNNSRAGGKRVAYGLHVIGYDAGEDAYDSVMTCAPKEDIDDGTFSVEVRPGRTFGAYTEIALKVYGSTFAGADGLVRFGEVKAQVLPL